MENLIILMQPCINLDLGQKKIIVKIPWRYLQSIVHPFQNQNKNLIDDTGL